MNLAPLLLKGDLRQRERNQLRKQQEAQGECEYICNELLTLHSQSIVTRENKRKRAATAEISDNEDPPEPEQR